MLTFYQSVPAVIFWQVSNQSFNAIVNYVNRNASSEVTNTQLLTSYGIATGSATGVALGKYPLLPRQYLVKDMAPMGHHAFRRV